MFSKSFYSFCEGLPRGTVANMVEKLLSRCVEEPERPSRLLLATCIGEIGAIGEHQLGDLNIGVPTDVESVDSPNSAYQWRLEQPPWQSRAAKYELQLVTKHLTIALKSAPSSADQHKVAFTIQQLLVLLDRSARETENDTIVEGSRNTKEMSKWLRDKLNESGVYEVVEPFWFSEFHEKVSSYSVDFDSCPQNDTNAKTLINSVRGLRCERATILSNFSLILLLDIQLLQMDDIISAEQCPQSLERLLFCLQNWR